MLSKNIVICSLFIAVSLGCGSINWNGVPVIPLHVCAGISVNTESGSRTFYYQYICDRTQTVALRSVHWSPGCMDETTLEVPYILESNEDVNCEHIYDCSYALYRSYNDTTNQCQHSTNTPYFELPLIIDHCGYDYTIQASYKYTCDDNTIYINMNLGDTEGKCQDTVQAPSITTGCDNATKQYDEVTGCKINPTPAPAPMPDDISTGAIIGIVVAVLAVLALLIIVGFVYYKKNKNKNNTGTVRSYTQVKQREDKTGYSTHTGHVGQAPPPIKQIQQIQQIQERPPPSYRSQPQETYQTAPKQEPPPSPILPPTQVIDIKECEKHSLIQQNDKLSVIVGWLRQNVELSEMDINNYADILIENGFEDLKSLKDLTMDDLQEIGIKKLGHKKAIIKAVKSDDCVLEPIY